MRGEYGYSSLLFSLIGMDMCKKIMGKPTSLGTWNTHSLSIVLA